MSDLKGLDEGCGQVGDEANGVRQDDLAPGWKLHLAQRWVQSLKQPEHETHEPDQGSTPRDLKQVRGHSMW